MSHIISIINQKGGVAKSTTAQNLTAGLRLRELNTLLIDLDPQGNTTYTTGIEDTPSTIYEVLIDRTDIKEAISQSKHFGDVIPAGKSLSNLDLELTSIGKEYKLKEALESIKNNYDFIIIDTPPSLSIITVNALTTSDYAIIPAMADIYSLQGIGQLYSTIQAIKDYCNPSLQVQGILLTRHSDRTILSRDLKETIEATAKQLDTTVYKEFIREGVAIREAQTKKQDIFSYAPKSNVALDYMFFMNEVIERSYKNE